MKGFWSHSDSLMILEPLRLSDATLNIKIYIVSLACVHAQLRVALRAPTRPTWHQHRRVGTDDQRHVARNPVLGAPSSRRQPRCEQAVVGICVESVVLGGAETSSMAVHWADVLPAARFGGGCLVSRRPRTTRQCHCLGAAENAA
jgi:hypothetical protein